MLTIATFRWGSKYPAHYVDRLRAAVKRNLKQEYRFAVLSPEEEDEYLTKIPGCFCRLRAFSPEWQAKHNLTDRIVVIDLDVVITGPLDELFDRPEPFVILRGANAYNPCPVNGSIWMLRAGYRPDVWSDFSLEAASKIKSFNYPDDQAWMDDRMPYAAGWECGPKSGIYSFAKCGWPTSNKLPDGARIVVFPGWRDPSKFTHLDWIKRNWA